MGFGNKIRKQVSATMIGCIFFPAFVSAQDTSSQKAPLQSRVFLDTYYSYDFSKPSSHEKASFLFNHNRHNEIAINLALAGLSYSAERIRGALALMMGTYTQYNLAAEPLVLRHLFEANAGVKLSATNNLWLDAGVMPSHIGFESAISKDCWTLTRSILAENSPYFETGARLSYTTPNEKWYLAGLYLNGWQRIARLPGNQTPAFGTQATFTPSEKWTFNWSTFVGSEKPDSVRQQRWFSNLYVVGRLSNHWGLTVGFDQGWEQAFPGASRYNKWYSPVVILRYTAGDWAVAGRAEYYSDRAGVMMPLVAARPFRMQGYSVNVDRKIGSNALWRVEGRLLHNREPYFERNGGLSLSNAFVTTSVAIDLR